MSTSDGYVCFSRDHFYSTKRKNEGIKLCERKIGHQARLGKISLFFLFDGSSIAAHLVALLSARATFSPLRALLCAEQDAQCNNRISP